MSIDFRATYRQFDAHQVQRSKGRLKILVVDDEAPARGRLLRMLEKVPEAVVVGEAENGTIALSKIALLRPDVVLLDVEMPGLDGLALAQTPGMPPIIFTTAHVHFAADAFDLEAIDYLVKPVRQERLERALERVKRRTTEKPKAAEVQLTVHGANGVRFVDAAKVTNFRALDKYTEFTLDGEQLLMRESLDALEQRLGEGFFRVHRAGLVRRDAVIGLERDGSGLVVKLVDGAVLEVSRRAAPELRRLLGLRK